MGDQTVHTEIPSTLKQLARLVVRGFYTIEDALIIDMLIRNPCMKEDDICELLKFERKQLRARIAMLKNDKFLQIRLKMETGPDGKAAKVNYYFINYKTFVNVVKYKLDLMRKRMETEERDATSRASFKCPNCCKTFTDLEADQLFDMTTCEFRCTFCGRIVEEDLSALPKKDSRLLLAKFNEQLQPLYDLLREVENIKLSPECLEPEPVDINSIRGLQKQNPKSSNEQWSGEATRNHGFSVEETRVDVTIGEIGASDSTIIQKDRPIWMTQSTVITNDSIDNVNDLRKESSNNTISSTSNTSSARHKKENEDIMSVLLQHEKQGNRLGTNQAAIKGLDMHNSNSSDSDDDRQDIDNNDVRNFEASESESADNDDVPVIMVSGKQYPIDEITDELVSQMTQQEKDVYIQVYQEYFSHIYD